MNPENLAKRKVGKSSTEAKTVRMAIEQFDELIEEEKANSSSSRFSQVNPRNHVKTDYVVLLSKQIKTLLKKDALDLDDATCFSRKVLL